MRKTSGPGLGTFKYGNVFIYREVLDRKLQITRFYTYLEFIKKKGIIKHICHRTLHNRTFISIELGKM
jgi:hypothetical protein